MAKIRHESRSRIGIDWYDNEAEADEAARNIPKDYSAARIEAANIGYVQVGRDRAFDRPGEYAVVIP